MGSPASVVHGPSIIGLFFSILLYGIMVTQTFIYFRSFRKDRLWMKSYVFVLFVADTLNCIFDCLWMYESVILHFGDQDFISRADWVFATDPAMTGIIAALVQFFFAWRIKVLTQSWWLVILVMIAASGGLPSCIGGLVGGLGTAIGVTIVPHFAEFQKFQPIVIVWLISNAICDLIITISLTWHLRAHKTGFPTTDDIVNKIIRSTVQTGMLTTVVAIADVGCFVGSTSGLHLAFNIPLSKLYTNSLMSTLNSRAGWYHATSEPSEKDPSAATTTAHREAPRARRSGVLKLNSARSQGVVVHVESHQMTDFDMDTSKGGPSLYQAGYESSQDDMTKRR